MNRLFRLTLLAAVAAVLSCSGMVQETHAGGVVVGSLIKMRNTPGAGDNGEFEVFVSTNSAYASINTSNARTTVTSLASREDFRTFCVEGGRDVEYFTPGREYMVAGLGLNTLSFATPKALPTLNTENGKKAAALYREFARQQTSGYSFNFFGNPLYGYSSTSADRNADANALQNAIWYYLGSISLGTTLNDAMGANRFVRAMENNLSYLTTLTVGANHIGGVQIMNLVDPKVVSDTLSSRFAQDQMYYNSSLDITTFGGPQPVPEPSSLMIFGAVAVGAVARRLRKKTDLN